MTARRWRISWTRSRATSCSRFPKTNFRDRDRHIAPGRAAQGEAVPALRPFRPFCLGPAVRAARSHQRGELRDENPRHPGQSLERPHVGLRSRRSTMKAPWCASITSSAATAGPLPNVGYPRAGAADRRRHQDLGRRLSGSDCAPARAAVEGLRRLNARGAAIHARAIAAVFSPADDGGRDLEILESLATREGGLKVAARACREAR